MRWISWTAKPRMSSTQSLNGRTCQSLASVSSVSTRLNKYPKFTRSHICVSCRQKAECSDHWCLCRYCKRSGSDWPDPAQTAGSSPVSPSAAALPSLQPGGAHGHCTGQACTGKCGLCDSELKLEPYRSLLFNQRRVFFSSGLGWRAPRRFCSSVLCQESFSCVGRRQESFGHLQVNAWTCFFL